MTTRSTSKSDNGIVRWRHLVPVLISIFAASTAAGAWIYHEHTQTGAHPGAVTKAQYSDGMNAVTSRLDRIEDKVDTLLNRGNH